MYGNLTTVVSAQPIIPTGLTVQKNGVRVSVRAEPGKPVGKLSYNISFRE
jgi:hypothetical protein